MKFRQTSILLFSLVVLMVSVLTPAVSATTITMNEATAHAAFTPRHFFDTVEFNNRIWVIGGLDDSNHKYNDVWYSSDGITWTQATAAAPFSPRYGHAVVVFDNKIWVIGGYDGSFRNDVWYSSDGTNWVRATSSAAFPRRTHHKAVVNNNRMWVIAGEVTENPWIYVNDVWYSYDGINWLQATAHADFSERMGHVSVAYNNNLWVISGVGDAYGLVKYNDVWQSADGITWINVTDTAPFTSRYDSDGVVADGRIWIIGGEDESKYNDIWSSPDGSQWTQVIPSTAFPGRALHSAAVFDNRIWITGGIGTSGSSLNDVWYSGEPINPSTTVPTTTVTTATPTPAPTQTVNHTVPVVSGWIEGKKVRISWGVITDPGFEGYKVVIAKNKQNPKYPEDGYVFWITDRYQTSVTIDNKNVYYGGDIGNNLVPGKKYWFSVTAVYTNDIVPGNAVELMVPESNNPNETMTTVPTGTSSVPTQSPVQTTLPTTQITTPVSPTVVPTGTETTKSVSEILEEQNKKLDEQQKLLEEQNRQLEEQNKQLKEQNDILTQIIRAFQQLFGWQ